MVKREVLLEDIKFLGECEYCKHNKDEYKFYETTPRCRGDCLQCEINECACNECLDFSKWKYFRD